MKNLFASIVLCCSIVDSLCAQDNFTAFGGGYSLANLNQPQFADFVVQVNKSNAGLTSPFTTDDVFKGFNLFLAFKNNKTLFTLGFARLSNRYRAEGTIPSISPNVASYTIGARQTSFSGQLDFFPVKILGFGGELGYNYSTFRNQQKDLFFGENNAVVDKKGGFYGGANLILHLPIGKVFVELQPYILKAFYKNDMDNVAQIYLGTGNSASAETKLSATGIHAKIGFKIQ